MSACFGIFFLGVGLSALSCFELWFLFAISVLSFVSLVLCLV
jgi:hypothetical protein